MQMSFRREAMIAAAEYVGASVYPCGTLLICRSMKVKQMPQDYHFEIGKATSDSGGNRCFFNWFLES